MTLLIFLPPAVLSAVSTTSCFVDLIYFDFVLVFLVDVEKLINDIGNHLDLARG